MVQPLNLGQVTVPVPDDLAELVTDVVLVPAHQDG
jgi:hypothetical protein